MPFQSACLKMYQRGYSSRFYLPPITDNSLRLVLLLISSFLIQWIVATFFYSGSHEQILIDHALFYQGRGFEQGFHPAQLVTHLLLTPPGFSGLLNIAFICLFVYFFGSELERQWGGYHFLRFIMFSSIGGILIACLMRMIPGMIQTGFIGPDASVFAVLIAYAMLWPNRTVHLYFIIPIKMKNLILGGALIYGLWSMLTGNMELLISMSGGALTGAIYLYYYAKKGMKKHSSENYYSTRSSSTGQTSTTTKKQSLTEKISDYKKAKRLKKKQEEIDFRIRVKNEVDRLLEKISKDGMASLSKKEKDFLDKASKMF